MATFDEIRNTSGVILSVDFGDVRTGLAVCDKGRILASGIGYVSVGGIEKTAAKVGEVAKEKSAVAVVIGHPVNMDGSLGFRAQRCEEFAKLVEAQLPGTPVLLMDERLTTMEASRYLNLTDTRGKKRKTVIDTLSAEILLQNLLDKLKF